MYTWSAFPFVRFAFAGIAGIFLFERWPQIWDSFYVVLGILLLLYLITWGIEFIWKRARLTLLSGCLGLAIVAYVFGWVMLQTNTLDDEDHFRHVSGRIVAYEGRVVSDVLEKETTRRYTVEVSRVLADSTETLVSGLLHLYIGKRDMIAMPLVYGDVIRVLGAPSEIPPPTNPEEFNYSAYIARQQIHGQSFVSPDRVEVMHNDPPSVVLERAYVLRAYLQKKILTYIQDRDAQAIALALLIGIKDFLSEDLTTAYSSTGAMHVLAVSGLHVGIFYMILLFVLKPIEKRPGGHIVIAVVSVFVIWGYTFVTGMSPSVLRAATMFSVFALSKALVRSSNIYNSLGISAFILLLYDPNLLYSVGFQLSFLAVTGIVYLQPRIYRLVYVRNKYLDKIWVITAVSIAAQIATLPLTIYYFNQFPTYFFLSNLVVIPGAFLIMIGGIFMLVVGSMADGLGIVVGFLVDYLIRAMNYLVLAVEQIPGSLITWLYFDNFQVWMVYGLIVLMLMAFYHRSSLYMGASLLATCLVLAWGHVKDRARSIRSELIVYDISGTTAIDVIAGRQAALYIEPDKEPDFEMLHFQIDPFRRANGLAPFDEGLSFFQSLAESKGVIKFGQVANQRVIILDSLLTGYTINPPIETDILVINNHSVKSVHWLKEHFRFKHLLIGSDNSWYYTTRLQKQLAEQQIASHSLLSQGSWRMTLSD